MSNGRVIFGAGLGVPDDFTKFGLPSDAKIRTEKLDEGLEIINGLWSGSSFSFKGQYYNINDVELPVVPMQKPRIPILLGGWWPNKKPFKRGARWDGIMPYWNSLPEPIPEKDLRDAINYYKENTDTPGEIIVPYSGDMSNDYNDLCRDVGATWLLAEGLSEKGQVALDMNKIKEGPPSAK